MKKPFLLLLGLTLGLSALCRAQTPADAPTFELELPEEDEVELDLPGSDDDAGVSLDAETISVDFPNEEVRTIIRNVADLYGLNVVVPDTLVGSVSVKLREVTWQQVFNVVLEPLGFTYVQEGNIIKIKSREDLLQEPVDTRVFVINFAQASELQAAINPMVDNAVGGRIQVDTRSNSLVVTERPSRMSKIQQIIERLDRPTDQVMIESKFVEITRSDVENIGVNWASLAGYNIGVSDLGRQFDRTRSSTSDVQDNNTNSTTLNSGGAGAGATLNDTLDQINNFSRMITSTRTDSALLSADAFNVVLSALEQNDTVELVTNPTVVTLNNTQAQINIGEEFPIPEYTFNEEQGSFEVSGFEFKPIGIILNVTPQVNSAGFINLNIQPEISSRAGSVNFGGASAAEIPIITTRKTMSTVSIKSGFTLAIGGLIDRQTSTEDNKVPVLGDIPFMGRLFKSSQNSLDMRNLIIFITAKVLNPDGSTYRDVFSQQRLWEMGIKSQDLPGYEPPPSEQSLFTELQKTRDELEQMRTEARLREQIGALKEEQDEEVESISEKENGKEIRLQRGSLQSE